MVVVSNQIRTITIEGVAFAPAEEGTKVPDNKVKDVENSFFFKVLVDDGSFTIKRTETREEPRSYNKKQKAE
jgi:hypothetical protein